MAKVYVYYFVTFYSPHAMLNVIIETTVEIKLKRDLLFELFLFIFVPSQNFIPEAKFGVKIKHLGIFTFRT